MPSGDGRDIGGQRALHVGPGVKPAEGIAGAQLELRDAGRFRARGTGTATGTASLDLRRDAADSAAARQRISTSRRSTSESFLSTNSKARLAAGERIHLRGHIHLQAQQIAVAVMHGDERDARHQKAEGQT